MEFNSGFKGLMGLLYLYLIPENFLLLALVYTLSETHFVSKNLSPLLD